MVLIPRKEEHLVASDANILRDLLHRVIPALGVARLPGHHANDSIIAVNNSAGLPVRC